MVASVLAATSVAGAASFTLAMGGTAARQGFIFGLLGLALPLIASDVLTGLFYRDDPLLSPRRVNIVSFVWCIAGGALLVALGAIAGFLDAPNLLLRGILLTIYSSASLRFLIYAVFSTRGAGRTALAISIQPVLLAAVSYMIIPSIWEAPPLVIVTVLGLTLLGPAILLIQIRKWVFSDGSIKIIPLFRAFIYAWAEQHSEPLEEQLAAVSETARLEIDELTFTDSSGASLGRLVAPYVHPGPFRNVGSSGLSLSLTEGLGDEAVVIHGVSSHEKDVTRSGDIARLVSAVMSAERGVASPTCTPMARAEVDGAKASCQIFGEAAVFTLTLSPKSHDDIPDAAKDRIRETASTHGLVAVVADAHNCFNHDDLLDDADIENLVAAAEVALEKALSLPKVPFEFGVARVRPEEWGLNEGMGPCGIAVVVIKTTAGKNAYIVFDTNNMIPGFREEILTHVSKLGFNSEAMTSDTHLVNAIGATDRGYHPAGEAMDHSRVLWYVDELLRVETKPAQAAFTRVAVDGVPIIGHRGIELLRGVVKTSFRVFIRTAATALPLTFLAAIAVTLLA